jgi:membrane fusion protein (multidrug efflux system)
VKKIWKFGLPILLILLVITVIVFRIISDAKIADARRQMMPIVKCEKPTREVVKISLQFNGDVLPILQAGIFSKVSGNLENIYADMGSKVYSGQLLATIDSTELYQQFQQSNATYQNARMTFDRVQQLIDKNLASKQDLDNADAAMKVAKANYEAAATRLSYARIIAPFSGIITKRFLDPGALVTANNATLFTLMDLDRIKIIVNIPEKDVQSIYKVRAAHVTLDALPGKEFEGIVTRVSDALDLTTRTMAIQIEVSNLAHAIKPGMFATVQMAVAEHPNAITLPTNSILKDDSSQYVFILDERRAKRLRVMIGAELLERTEIISGLVGNETIITVGQQFVKDGGIVSVQQ